MLSQEIPVVPSSNFQFESSLDIGFVRNKRGGLKASKHETATLLSVRSPSAVPLPGAFWLMGTGVLALVIRRKPIGDS